MNATAIHDEMLEQAAAAAEAKLREIGGDRYACGFSWVTIFPKHKGNTRDGKAERKILTDMGFRKDWTGKAYEFWNPSRWPGQNIDVKEAGAYAAADVLRKHGFKAYAGSRLD